MLPTNNRTEQLNDSKVWFPISSNRNIHKGLLLFYASDPRAIAGWSGRVLIRGDIDGTFL